MTFEEALIGARDDHLHPAIRSKYVELIVGNNTLTLNESYLYLCYYMCVVLYVDVGDNRAILDNLSF